MDYSWCHVKFIEDNAVANVSTSFFKVVVEKLLEPHELRTNEVYDVFWSPDVNESPLDVMKKGNAVVNVGDMSEKERKRLSKSKQPLKGYFKAVLLDLKNEEDSFEDSSTSGTTSLKRVRIPSSKVTESIASSAALDHPSSSDGAKKKLGKKVAKLAAQEASQANIMSLLHKISDQETPTNKAMKKSNETDDSDTSSSSDSSSNEEEHSVQYWKQKYLEFVQGNMDKEAPSKKKGKRKKKDKKKSKSSKTFHRHGKNEKGNTSAKKLKFSEPEGTMSRGKISFKNLEKDEQEINDLVSASDPSAGFVQPQNHDAESSASNESKSDVSLSVSPADNLKNDSEREQKVRIIKKAKVKVGKAGDSLFIMNKAAELWDQKTLAIRSPTGIPAPSSRKGRKAAEDYDKSKAYPKATPEKIKDLRESLIQRIKEEEPDISPEDMEDRMKDVNYHVGQKVCVARRSLRAKGLTIPTPDQVWQVKESGAADVTAAAYKIAAQSEKTEESS